VHRKISERSYEVSLLTKHHTYVCVDSDGQLIVDRTNIGTWEKFELSLIQKYGDNSAVRREGKVDEFDAFLSSFLKADGAAVEKAGVPTSLVMIKSPVEATDYRGKVSLRNIAAGTYLSAHPAEKSYLVSGDATWVREAEGYELHSTAPGIAGFRTVNGTWLCGEPSGKVVNDRKSLVNWEQFYIFVNGKINDRSFDISLRTYHGKFVRLLKGELIADQAEITPEARFELRLLDKYNDGPTVLPVIGRVSLSTYWEFLFPLLGASNSH